MGIICCVEPKCCIDRSSTINPEHLLKQNSKEIENLNQSRINVPFRVDTPDNQSLQIKSVDESKNSQNFEEEVLRKDSLESLQYYSNFDNANNSQISSIKDSEKDVSKYKPTLFKNWSLKKNDEIYFPQENEEEEKNLHEFNKMRGKRTLTPRN